MRTLMESKMQPDACPGAAATTTRVPGVPTKVHVPGLGWTLLALGWFSARAGAEPESGLAQREAARPVSDGEVLPWTKEARHQDPGFIVSMFGGRDGSTTTNVASASIEATIIDRVSARATFANSGDNPVMHPTAGLSVDVLRQTSHLVDLALGADYASKGFNQVPALILHAAIGRRGGDALVLANLEYGEGLEQGERYGAVRLAAITKIANRWYAGIDSQAHLDLERDAHEPAEEHDFDLQVDPVVSYAINRFALSASLDAAAWQLRLAPDRHLGAVGLLGASAVF